MSGADRADRADKCFSIGWKKVSIFLECIVLYFLQIVYRLSTYHPDSQFHESQSVVQFDQDGVRSQPTPHESPL